MVNEWTKLDNAAKIFPSSSKGTDNHVFRFVCELVDDVDPVVLQWAVENTLEIFDLYRVTLKRGFFWYYLEPIEDMPQVKEEDAKLCATIYDPQEKRLLLEVTYYHKRINLEIFHVLSDGTGSIAFLRMLINKYLSKKLGIPEPPLDFDASRTQMQDDSFSKYYAGDATYKPSAIKQVSACQLKGQKYSETRMRIITGAIAVSDILELAHRHSTTLTIYLSACLMEALGAVMSARDKKRPVVLCVPVNLRRYFPSETLRNFFATTYVAYDFSKRDGSFDDIILAVSESFKENITKEKMTDILNNYAAAESNPLAKIVPLSVKDWYLNMAYRRNLGASTATISNVGVIKMPEILEPHIRQFDVTSGTHKMHVCLCTFAGKVSVNFSTPYVNSDVERNFFRHFTSQDIACEITSNNLDGYEDLLKSNLKK